MKRLLNSLEASFAEFCRRRIAYRPKGYTHDGIRLEYRIGTNSHLLDNLLRFRNILVRL